jgi:phosphoglycolate phosphatase
VIEAILFDKDGTLVDFRATWLRAYRAVAAELALKAGQPPEFAQILLGRSGYDALADRFADESPLLWATNAEIARGWQAQPELESSLDVLEVVTRHFEDRERYPPQPAGDLPALLGRLKARGLKLGLATMDSCAAADDTARRLGIDGFLDFSTGCDGGFGHKPDPGMVLGFCAGVGVAPDAVMVVGDTHADLLMARNGGCRLAVAVLTGGTPRHVLDRLADHVLGTVQEVESLLG